MCLCTYIVVLCCRNHVTLNNVTHIAARVVTRDHSSVFAIAMMRLLVLGWRLMETRRNDLTSR